MLAGPGGDPSELPWAPSPGPGLGLAPRRRRRLAALTLGSGPPASAAASLAALALGLALGRLALGRLALVSHSGGRVRYSGRRRPSTGDSHCSHTACKQCKAHTESHNAQMDHGVTMGSTVHRQTQVHKLQAEATAHKAQGQPCRPTSHVPTFRFSAAFTSRLMTLSQVTHCFSRCWGPSTRKFLQVWHRWDVQNSSCQGVVCGLWGRGGGVEGVLEYMPHEHSPPALGRTPGTAHDPCAPNAAAYTRLAPRTQGTHRARRWRYPTPQGFPKSSQRHMHNTHQVHHPPVLLEVVQNGLQRGRRG